MAVARFRSRPAWFVSAGLAVVAALIVVMAVLLTGHQQPAPIDAQPIEPEPEPEPEPEAEPEPEPPPPVEGTVVDVSVADLSVHGWGLFRQGSEADAAVAIDTGAVDAFVSDLRAWLDAHLTDLQDDGPGLGGNLVGDTAAFTTELTNSQAPVTAATYEIRIGARGKPEWARVAVTVVRADEAHELMYAFVPGDEPVLVAAELRSSDDAGGEDEDADDAETVP